jgi:hypothetical protein
MGFDLPAQMADVDPQGLSVLALTVCGTPYPLEYHLGGNDAIRVLGQASKDVELDPRQLDLLSRTPDPALRQVDL